MAINFKKLLLGLVIFTFYFSALGLLTTLKANPSCSDYTNADGAITYTDNTSGVFSACLITPQSMTIDLHFIGLCKEQPTIANFRTVCSSLFTSTTGETKTISTTTSANLMNDVTLDEGTYTHAAILIKNALSYSAKIKFSPARTGKTGTGEWCWSLDGNTGTVNTAVGSQATWIAECGAAAPSSFGSNSSSPNAIFSVASGNRYDNFETGTTASTSWTVYLLKADETLNTGTAGNYASFGTASYFLGIQQFNTAVSITPRTSNLDVGFRLEDTFRVETVENAGTHYIPQFGMGGFEFKVLTSE